MGSGGQPVVVVACRGTQPFLTMLVNEDPELPRQVVRIVDQGGGAILRCVAPPPEAQS